MKVEVLSKKEDSLVLVLSDADVSFANALRRAMLAEVPTLAIEEVTFIENTSPLYDEIIAHRLGLVPIKTDLKAFNLRSECKCEGKGCSSCTLKLTLSASGPCTVYSHDLVSEDSKLKPIEGIPIVKLGKGQKLTLEAEAILGTGKMHAKWQPAVVGYKYYPEIEISEKCDGCEACAAACPKNILSVVKKKARVSDETICTLCNACVEACDLDAIKVRGNERKLIFTIESSGALKPEEIFNKAGEIVQSKAEQLAELL